jgi:hypothetical protein
MKETRPFDYFMVYEICGSNYITMFFTVFLPTQSAVD